VAEVEHLWLSTDDFVSSVRIPPFPITLYGYRYTTRHAMEYGQSSVIAKVLGYVRCPLGMPPLSLA
jgi:hypothetical protein